LDDLTDIYNRFEAGQEDGDLWFIRRLNAGLLGCAWTIENGKRYCITWKDGKMIKTLDPEPALNLRAGASFSAASHWFCTSRFTSAQHHRP